MKSIYFKKNILLNSRGQVMLLAILLISSSILVFTSIAGYLMLEKIRMASNVVDSTKAIMAADSGIECELFNKYKDPDIDCKNLSFKDSLVKISTAVDAAGIKSIGTSNKSKRAFYSSF